MDELWTILVPVVIFPGCFLVVSIVYFSVCYCYDVVVGEDSKDRRWDFCSAMCTLACATVPNLTWSPLIILCMCRFGRRNGSCTPGNFPNEFLPRVCPCCFKSQFACYWPWCGHQDYITVDCPCFCCCSDPFIRKQIATPVVTIQPDCTVDIFTITTQSDPQPQMNTDVLSPVADGGSTTVIIEEGEEDVTPVAMYGEKVRWAFPR